MARKPIKKKKPPVEKAPPKKGPAKPVSGTLTERMGEAKSRPNKGLPAKIERPRGNINRAVTPDKIKLGGAGGTSRSVTVPKKAPVGFKKVPLNPAPKLLGGPAGAVARAGAGMAATRALQYATGPVGFLVGMTTPTGDGNEASPPKYGRTLREQAAQRKKQAFGTGGGNPKTVNPYKARTVGDKGVSKTVNPYRTASEPAKTRSVTTPPYAGLNKGPSAKAVPKDTAKEKMKRQQQGMKPDKAKPSVTAPRPKARPAAPSEKKYGGMTFQEASRRNMQAEYERAKRKPKGTLLGLLRR